ncbi:general transcription factor IIH subunit 1 [Anabrus simplex]|uniref:general transcription factor IIH subunit 1 n=1 Tax=Anabrus simplex TaxID=316456 RepID=UPI0034DD6C13
MATSSEDVLLQVPEVRYKKGDGTLFVMNERLAWMLSNRDTMCVSHRYTDIKMQKISPEGKQKVQLQVTLHDGSTSTFHFVNRHGIAAQVKDRDNVKEVLQRLLYKVKRQVNEELQEKNRLLSENPVLLQLYKDLVIPEVISSEEFWKQQGEKYSLKQSSKQDIGVSGAFLTGIKPQTDGCNGLRYNLTADIIQCIFKTYPAVRKKHLEYVPNKLSEAQFWTKFFQSHYFHRDRIHSESRDLFADCAKLDDDALRKDIKAGIEDPLLDLTKFVDKTLEEGYGFGGDKSYSQSDNIVHQSMIKRFNQHSIMVLKTCQQNPLYYDRGSENVMPANSSSSQEFTCNGSTKTLSAQPTAKRARINEKITIEDLDSDNNSQNSVSNWLHLSQVDRYRHGPLVKTNEDTLSNHNPIAVWDQILEETEYWTVLRSQSKKRLVTPALAVSVLSELSPGGSLMTTSFQDEGLIEMIPPDIQHETKNIYMSLCELLRHFWACFPPTTAELENKVVHMHSALQRFRLARLAPFEDRISREIPALRQHTIAHLNKLLNSAFSKFEMWQQRV